MRQFKYLVFISVVILLYFAYSRYGYLLQSYRNLPRPTTTSDNSSDPSLSFLTLPKGFEITYFSSQVPGARSLALGNNGIIYVGSRPQGVVYALEDQDQDGLADNRFLVASGLNSPNGIAYREGDLYVAEIHRIIVFRDIDINFRNQPTFQVIYDQLPKDSHHGWRYLKFGPDGKIYIGIGAPCNVCTVEEPYGSLARLNTDGSGFEIVANGIRNTVGFDWHRDGSLWFTDNGRDQMGDDVPPDELNLIDREDGHYGFPYCHGTNIPDPKFGQGLNCRDYLSPKLNLGPHVAALGIHFYRGTVLPDEYRERVIIAEHGSWNRSTPIGYRLMTAEIRGGRATGYHEFVTGWLDENGDAKGRPVDILELPDGSLLVSDDFAGAVYRLSYSTSLPE